VEGAVVEVVGLAEDGADEAGRLVDEEMGRTDKEETARVEEGVTALLDVTAADEGRILDEETMGGRTEELVMAEEAGRADEVESRVEVVTANEDARVDEITEDALEAEAEVVTGLVLDELLIS
jgi:hypothetical protein